MKILVLNGSPKGKNSVTLQTARYLEKRFPDHTYEYLDIGKYIKKFEKDFSSAKDALEKADLIVFLYPVYTFIVPFQVVRFIELMKEHCVDVSGKYASQISTSKHFYDVTAYKYLEQNCFDMGLRCVEGLCADMEDLLEENGQRQADCYFEKMMFDIENAIFDTGTMRFKPEKKSIYQPSIANSEKKGKDVVIVTNVAPEDTNLKNMIEDLKTLVRTLCVKLM